MHTFGMPLPWAETFRGSQNLRRQAGPHRQAARPTTTGPAWVCSLSSCGLPQWTPHSRQRTGGQSLLSAFFLPFLPHYLLLYCSDLHFNILFQTKVMMGPKKVFFSFRIMYVCVCVCVCVYVVVVIKNITKFTSLTIIKCAAQWHYIHSHCCANTTIQLQTLFYCPQNWNNSSTFSFPPCPWHPKRFCGMNEWRHE